jgi:hypothetical protein
MRIKWSRFPREIMAMILVRAGVASWAAFRISCSEFNEAFQFGFAGVINGLRNREVDYSFEYRIVNTIYRYELIISGCQLSDVRTSESMSAIQSPIHQGRRTKYDVLPGACMPTLLRGPMFIKHSHTTVVEQRHAVYRIYLGAMVSGMIPFHIAVMRMNSKSAVEQMRVYHGTLKRNRQIRIRGNSYHPWDLDGYRLVGSFKSYIINTIFHGVYIPIIYSPDWIDGVSAIIRDSPCRCIPNVDAEFWPSGVPKKYLEYHTWSSEPGIPFISFECNCIGEFVGVTSLWQRDGRRSYHVVRDNFGAIIERGVCTSHKLRAHPLPGWSNTCFNKEWINILGYLGVLSMFR